MKISKLTINGMHKIVSPTTYTFEQVNYVLGQNGAGKSTILQAIQLALLGYIPGYDKKKEAIFSHANGRCMEVKLLLDNGNMIERVYTNTGKNIVTSVNTVPEGLDPLSLVADLELPVFNFSEFKDMTANKLKEWFIRFLPSSECEIDWSSELSTAVDSISNPEKSQIIDNALSRVNELADNYSGVDLVAAANAHFKSEISYLKGKIEQLQGTLNSLVWYDDLVTTESPSAIQAKIADLQNDLVLVAQYEGELATYQKTSGMLAEYSGLADTFMNDPEYISHNSHLTEVRLKLDQLKLDPNIDTEIASKNAQINQLAVDARVLDGQIKQGDICPFTQECCDQIKSKLANLSDQLNEVLSKKQILEAELAELMQSRQEYLAAQNTLVTEQKAIQSKMTDIQHRYETRDRLKASIGPAPTCSVAIPRSSIESLIAELSETLSKSIANVKYTELSDAATADKFKAELELEMYKQWAKLTDANNLQTRIMNQPFEKMAGQMTKEISELFGSEYSAAFNLSEKANSFSFGLNVSGRYIAYDLLSSGEKCMYSIALINHVVNNSNVLLPIVLVDDSFDHLDDVNLGKLFESLNNVEDIQYIVAGVKPYNGCNIITID